MNLDSDNSIFMIENKFSYRIYNYISNFVEPFKINSRIKISYFFGGTIHF